jgi:hypothetical protein
MPFVFDGYQCTREGGLGIDGCEVAQVVESVEGDAMLVEAVEKSPSLWEACKHGEVGADLDRIRLSKGFSGTECTVPDQPKEPPTPSKCSPFSRPVQLAH